MDVRRHPGLVAAVFAVLLLVCGGVVLLSGGSKPDAVVQRINGESDCRVLQAEFDQAEAIHNRDGGSKATGWMRAVDARMRQVGCY